MQEDIFILIESYRRDLTDVEQVIADYFLSKKAPIRIDQLAKKQAVSKKRENYGMAHTTSFVPKPMEFEVSMTEVTRALLAVQLSGELNPLTTAGGAFADVPVVASPGGWVNIGHSA